MLHLLERRVTGADIAAAKTSVRLSLARLPGLEQLQSSCFDPGTNPVPALLSGGHKRKLLIAPSRRDNENSSETETLSPHQGDGLAASL